MKKEKYLFLATTALFCFCFLSQTAFAQTIIRRQDFDSNTGWTVTATPSNATSILNSGAINPSNPTAATYGAQSAITTTDLLGNDAASAGRAASGAGVAGGNVVLDFARIGPAAFSGTSDLFISFRIAGLGETETEGLDNADTAVVSISLDNGLTYTDEALVGGRSNPDTGNTGSVWNYNRSESAEVNYDGDGDVEGAKTFRPDVGGSVNGAGSISKITIRIPNANLATSTGLFFRVTLNVNGTNELIAVDDFIAYLVAPTAAPAKVSGRIVNSLGRGISKASITATGASGQKYSALTNPFGYYNFSGLNAGETYVFEVRRKGYNFAPQVLFLGDNLSDLNFTPIEPENGFDQNSKSNK